MMCTRRLVPALALAGILGIAAYRPASAQNLVVNGSFEDIGSGVTTTPGVTVTEVNAVDQFPSIPGWTLAFGSSIELQGQYLQYDLGGGRILKSKALDGLNHLELNSTGPSGIYQNVSTTPGQHYLLSFGFSPLPSTGPAFNHVKVFWGGAVVADVQADGTNNNDNQWTVYTVCVSAPTSTTRLQFEYAGSSAAPAYGTEIDAISLVKSTPTPGRSVSASGDLDNPYSGASDAHANLNVSVDSHSNINGTFTYTDKHAGISVYGTDFCSLVSQGSSVLITGTGKNNKTEAVNFTIVVDKSHGTFGVTIYDATTGGIIYQINDDLEGRISVH